MSWRKKRIYERTTYHFSASINTDLLAVNNLVNYFGRQDEVDKVDISPILLQKGNTKVALYGLGSLRDERLNRMWERQKVRFCRPADDDRNENHDDNDDEEDEGFFNIFTLHQNRDLGRGSKNCVQESMIPEWMDLVVWGHEHECLIEFFESVVGTFRITQPGSSVATSLVPGEAARKKIGILDVKGRNFRLHPVPLTQCRTFVTTSLSLREHRTELDPEDPKVDAKITTMLVEEVELLRKNALDRMEEVLVDARKAGNNAGEKDCNLKYKLHRPEEVLVRIRVEHSGFSTINNQRFGAQFVGKVANPGDILLFHRKKDPRLASTVKRKALQPVPPEELERTDMFDLIKGQLEAPDSKLSFFKETDLSLALDDYVEKGVIQAITELAKESLANKQKILVEKSHQNNDKSMEKESQICDLLDRDSSMAETSMKMDENVNMNKNNEIPPSDHEKENSLIQDDFDDEFTKPIKRASAATKQPPPPKGLAKKSTNKRRLLDDEDSSDEEHATSENLSNSKSKQMQVDRPKRRGGQRKAYILNDSEDDDEGSFVVDDEDDDEELVVEKQTAKEKKATISTGSKRKAPSKKAAPSRSTTTSGTTRKPSSRSKALRRHQFDDSDDDSVEYLGESAGLEANWGSAATKSQRHWP